MFSKALLSTGLWATTTLAFQGTSPFFMMSNSQYSKVPSISQQVATSEQINRDTTAFLAQCPSVVYVFTYQPGISADDFVDLEATTPFSHKWTSTPKFVVPEVIGDSLDQDTAIKSLQTICGAHLVETEISSEAGIIPETSERPQILRLQQSLLPLHGGERRAAIIEHHSFVNSVLYSISDRSFTIIYHGTPPPEAYFSYTPSSKGNSAKAPEKAVHAELKRDISRRTMGKRQDDSTASSVGLFEKYNFFSPAIFMGGLALIILFSIGSVGISALSSVQVSYAAFSKEMGPSAQKKQQ